MKFEFDEERYFIPEDIEWDFLFGKTGAKNSPLILISDRDNTPNNIKLLDKIITYINFKIDENCCVILVKADKQYNINKLVNYAPSKSIISFGLHENEIPILFNITRYEWIILNEYKLLFADSLNTLINNNSLKKKLWTALKLNYKKD